MRACPSIRADSQLLAKPPDWEIRAGALPRLLKDNSDRGHLGRDKPRRFLRELEQAGYLKRTRMHGENGRWIWRSIFTAVPTVDGLAVDGSPADGKGVDINQTLVTTDGITSDSITLQVGTRSAAEAKTVVGLNKEFRFPEVLSGKHLASARALVSTCPPEHCQAVLDEIAAVHRHGRLRSSPIGLLHRLIQHAKAGTFFPSHAITYQEKQRREAQERTLLLERRSHGPATGAVPVGRIAEETIAGLRAKLKDQEK